MVLEEQIVEFRSKGYVVFYHNKQLYKFTPLELSQWTREKHRAFFEETGLRIFKETRGHQNWVFYDTNFSVKMSDSGDFLHYDGDGGNITQPYNCSSFYRMFEDFNGKSLSLDWQTSFVVDFHHMFLDCINLESLSIGGWDVSNGTDLSGMFSRCHSLKSLDVKDWRVTNCTDFHEMFYGCESLVDLDLYAWDTSNAINFSRMFKECSSITLLELSNWSVNSVHDFRWMFDGCTSLLNANFDKWSIKDNARLFGMFDNCKLLEMYLCNSNQELVKKLFNHDLAFHDKPLSESDTVNFLAAF